MLRLVTILGEIVGKPKKLSAKSHLLRNFLAIRLPDCRTFSTYGCGVHFPKIVVGVGVVVAEI